MNRRRTATSGWWSRRGPTGSRRPRSSHMRRLGVTKVQLGVQSLDERILALNQRGHDVEAVRRAVRLLRAAGFKLHLHWMPNLLGATPESDREDFARLWSDPPFGRTNSRYIPARSSRARSCTLCGGRASSGRTRTRNWSPLVADCKATIPPYCRVNRVFRDIPADDIVAGSKRSNLRQLVASTARQPGPALHVHPLPGGARRAHRRGATSAGGRARTIRTATGSSS